MAEMPKVEQCFSGLSAELELFIVLLMQETCGTLMDQAVISSDPIQKEPPSFQNAEEDRNK